LVLVILPCFIDIICLWALYDLTARTERIAEEEHHIMEIVRHANTVMILYTATKAKFLNVLAATKGPYRDKTLAEGIDGIAQCIGATSVLNGHGRS
jgi:hypothetical protein